MRVALVSGYDWAVPGGAQGQVAILAGALARRGQQVAVITPRRAGEGPRPAGVLLLEAGHSVSLPVNGSQAPVAPGPGAWRATWRALTRFRPDVVHVHEPLLPGPPLAAVLRSACPVVATFHRSGTDAAYRGEGRLIGPFVARRLAAAVAVSPAAAETARAVLGPRAPVIGEIGNGVDLARFALARESLGEGGGAYKEGSSPTVVFLGRLEPRKGVEILLEAAAALGPEVRLLIAGEGPEGARLRERAAGDRRVSFLGRMSDAEAARLLAGADAFVSPALGGESFGVVLLEAMAAGTAVVASDIAGYRLAAAGAARLFPPGDSRALGAALGEVLEDPVVRSGLVRRGRRRAEECSIEVVAERYEALYGEVLRGSRPGRPVDSDRAT